MSDQSSEYDPMAVHSEVDNIYTSPDLIEHAKLMRSIGQANPGRMQLRTYKWRVISIHCPELLGSYGIERGEEVPVAPPFESK